MKKPTYNFFHRLQLAISGIYVAFARERHMKAHLLWGTGLLLPLTFIEVKITHRFILILLLANVIVIELINTAIETTIDLVTRRYSYRAKLAKDMASGAVLLHH